jgi:hypothetical protein
VLSVEQIREAVMQIAPAYPIKTVKLFGSYADGRAKESSDVDLLVSFIENPTSLFDIFGFKGDMSDALSVKVDVLKDPLNPKTLIYPDFEISREVLLFEKER